MEINIERALSVHGFMPRNQLVWLAQQASKAKLIVEIGCFRGRGTRAMADNLKPGGHIFTIDTWEGSQSLKSAPSRKEIERVGSDVVERQFNDNLHDHIEAGRVTPIRWDSQQGIPPVLAPYMNSVDFLFIDGDHSEAAVRSDILTFRRLVRDGGIVSGDDYLRVALPGLRRAVDEIYPKKELFGRIWYVTKR